MANEFPQMPEGGFVEMNGFGGFNDECDGTCEHDDEFYDKGVDFPRLIRDLDVSRYPPALNEKKFNYEHYQGTERMETGPGGSFGKAIENVQLRYNHPVTGKIVNTSLKGKLNQVECCIRTYPAFSTVINTDKIEYSIYYLYKDAGSFQSDMIARPDSATAYNIDEKYKAIVLQSSNADDIIQVLYETGQRNLVDFFKEDTKKKFLKALLSISDASQLNELYSNAPDFALTYFSNFVGKEKMWEHLLLLLNYDDTGLWSFIKDSSNAVVNLLRGINDAEFLYGRFYKNPVLVKRIYRDMDSTSEMEGQEISNRKIFSSLLNSICYGNISKVKRTGDYFYISKGQKPDSNLYSGNDIYEDKIFLTQLTEHIVEEEQVVYDDESLSGAGKTFHVPTPRFSADGPGKYYHPLDTVILQDETGRQIEVTALFVKDIADELEWAEIMENVRLGINIFVMVVSLATMLAGPGAFLFVLSAIDFGLAASDVVIQGVKEELMKTEGGKEFLEIWEKVYTIGGIATAGPAVVTGLFSAGARLWAKLSSGAARDFVAAVLMRVVMEVNMANFTGIPLRIVDAAEVSKLTKDVLSFYPMTRLQKEGVIFMTGTKSERGVTTELIFCIYKSEVIASGTAEQVHRMIREIFFIKGAQLRGALEKLLEQAPKLRDGFWEATNAAGKKMKWKLQDFTKSEKNKLSSLFNSGDSGKRFEAIVAQKIEEYDHIVSFHNDIISVEEGRMMGDIDLETDKYFFEFKESISQGVLKNRHLDKQFSKYTNPSSEGFFNFRKKPVVLFVGKLNGVKVNHFGFRRLTKMGVLIITDLNKLKKIY